MLISVVVPSYNHQKYVEECLESIVTQRHPELELVFVDDLSTDLTLEVAQAFVSKHSRRFASSTVTRNKMNRGAHFSLNRGILLSEGEYIFFMNSDDSFAPGRIECVLDEMRRHNALFAFSDVEPIDDNSDPIYDEQLCHSIAMSPSIAREIFPSLSWGFLWRQIAASTGNFVVKRELIDIIGGFANLKYCHDWDFALRAIRVEEPVYVAEKLYNYRFHAGNSFRSLSDVATAETRKVVEAYLMSVMNEMPPNPTAPAPQNYPRSFRTFFSRLPIYRIFRDMYDPYEQHHRTIQQVGLTSGQGRA